MAVTKKSPVAKSTKIGFKDLDSKLKILTFVVLAVVIGIITLELTGATSANGLQWLSRNKGRGWNFNFSLPQNSGSNSGVNCNNSGGSNITTGDATAGPGGVANTGGNTACGTH